MIATEGEERFTAALARRSRCRRCTPGSTFVLSAMAGHLFGYEAALAIDAQARPLREARGAIEAAVVGRHRQRGRRSRPCAPRFEPLAGRFFDGLRSGEYDGHLEASTAVRLSSLFRYALGQVPARLVPDRVRQGRHAGRGARGPHRARSPGPSRSSPAPSTPSSTRPRRSPWASPAPTRRCCRCRSWPRCSPPARPATASLRDAAHAGRPRPRRRRGARLHPLPRRGRRRRGARPPRSSSTRAASPASCPSRTEREPRLRGTKHRVAAERRLLVAQGRTDGRSIIIVPEVKDNQTTGLTLLHVRFAEQPALAARAGCPAGLPQPLLGAARRGHRDRADLPRGPARRPRRGRPADRLRSTSWPTTGARADRSPPGALMEIVGIGTDLVDVDRFRRVLERTPSIAAPAVHRGGAGLAASRSDPVEALRRPVRGQGGGDEGARRRAGRGAPARHRGGAGRVGRAVGACCTARPPSVAAERRACTRWLVTLTHTDTTPSPWWSPPRRRRRWSPRSSAGDRETAPRDPDRDARGDGGHRRRRARAGRGADRPGRVRPSPGPRVGLLGGTYGRRVVVIAGQGQQRQRRP